jgi:hypothetical protein
VIESLARQGIDVSHACRVLGVSQSGYYDWKSRPLSPRAIRRIWLAGEIADVHKASAGTYGALRVTAELRHGRESASATTPSSRSCASSASRAYRPGAGREEREWRGSRRWIWSGACSHARARTSRG